MAENALLKAEFSAFTFSARRISILWNRERNRISAISCSAGFTRCSGPVPGLVIQSDDLAKAMVDVVLRETGERGGLILENRDIQAMV